MSSSRTKNAARNIVYGFLNRFVILILPFITRTIILRLLGASFLGIGTLFTSVLSFLSLTELGLGSAIVYSMYRPLAVKDYNTVGAYLNYYKRLYRFVGTVILIIGTAIVPIIPYIIKGDVPHGINIYILYYVYLINSVISYFFAGYRQSLLTANQRADITSKISSTIHVFVQFGQIIALFFTRNFYVYAIVPICGTIITNLTNALLTRKMYPMIICEGGISRDAKLAIRSKISGLFGTKLNSIVVHSSDVLIISAFLGLTLTAQYGNYYYIMNAVCGFVSVFFSSMTAGIGNKLVQDTLEDNYKLFCDLSFINAWIVGWCSCCFVCLYEPFMTIWVGTDQQLGVLFVLLLAVYFYVYEIQRTILLYKDAAGLWNKDKARPYIAMIINLVSNVILVQYMGIYGIVISTILAFSVSVPWANYVLFSELFKRNPWVNLFVIVKRMLVTVCATGLTYTMCYFCSTGVFGLLLRIMLCSIIPNLVFAVVYKENESFVFLQTRIKKILRKV